MWAGHITVHDHSLVDGSALKLAVFDRASGEMEYNLATLERLGIARADVDAALAARVREKWSR